jgi:hypothetical protein
MPITTLASRELNQDTGRAKKANAEAPSSSQTAGARVIRWAESVDVSSLFVSTITMLELEIGC